MFKIKKVFYILPILFAFIVFVSTIYGQEATNNAVKSDLEKKIQEYTEKLDDLGTQKNSLEKEKKSIENQVIVTGYKIESASIEISDKIKEIEFLTEDLNFLETRLDKIVDSISSQEDIFSRRIREKYKTSRVSSVPLLVTSKGFSTFMSKLKYDQIAEERDKSLLGDMKSTQKSYEAQQGILGDKRLEIEQAKKSLEAQKVEAERLKTELSELKVQKEYLLKVTKDDESKYQQLLETTKEELKAIEAILSGVGIVGNGVDVKKGTVIASVISGSSCNSSGSHLHFIVRKDGTTVNPFKYLKSVDYTNCSGSSCGSSNGDQFNPSGKWDWPLKSPVVLTQGYGNTWATRAGVVFYNFHDGIDIQSSSLSVYAVADGTYFKGYYSGWNGCRLNYVRMDHKDGDFQTYYLHVNY